MRADVDDLGEFLADVRALDAAGADTIWLEGAGLDPWIVLGAMAAVTARVRLGCQDAGATAHAEETLQKLSRGRVVSGQAAGEVWRSISVPPDREAWAAALREHESSGATGVVVPWDPRLIDLLRNPEPDDRADLQMSTG